MKITRHQFYTLAALATFSHGTVISFDTKKGQAENGDIQIGWKPKKNSNHYERRGPKGFVIAKMDKNGNISFLKGK